MTDSTDSTDSTDQPFAPETFSYSRVGELAAVRSFVRARALRLGLSERRADLLTLAVHELAGNTVQHTTGGGRVRMWGEVGSVFCDVVDQGRERPLGRGMPAPDALRGRGLPLVERIGDEVTTWTGPDGTAVRIRLDL
jgi:anti-sigma regulatory factor (Ser/Thr protein kinase)